MKIRTYIYIVAGLLTLALNSCDKVDEDDRFVYMKPEAMGRNVLVEDFTGQNCKNCPDAHVVIEQFQEAYGKDRVVAVSIHAGGLAIFYRDEAHPNGRPYGLKTDLGETYNNFWNITSWPNGTVNRTGVLAHTSWGAKILEDLQKPSPVNIDVETAYDNSSRELKVDINTVALETVSGKIQVWLLEDGIVAPQAMPDNKTNPQYVHNNVFRDALNGAWGDDYRASEGASLDFSYSYNVAERYKAENLAVIVFIYNDNGVLQVIRKPLFDNDTEETPAE